MNALAVPVNDELAAVLVEEDGPRYSIGEAPVADW